MKLTDHFTVEEFQCKCCHKIDMDADFVTRIEAFRVEWGKPMKVLSGFRCPKHNAEVGGTRKSQHPCGKAGDFEVMPSDRYAFIALAIKHKFRGIGVAKDFIHLDTRSDPPAVWKY